jgi:hypothetical protein
VADVVACMVAPTLRRRADGRMSWRRREGVLDEPGAEGDVADVEGHALRHLEVHERAVGGFG